MPRTYAEYADHTPVVVDMILVTGATGNVGREVMSRLPDARALDRRSGADRNVSAYS